MHKAVFFFAFMLVAEGVLAEPIRILFGGDVTLGENYQAIAREARFNPGFSWEKISGLIDASDYFVINLETAVTEHTVRVPKKFNCKMKKEELVVLKAGRVNLVSLANNHSFDFGRRGLEDSLSALRENEIRQIGAGANLEEARLAHRVVLKEKHISFLAYGNMSEHPDAQKFVAYRNKEHVQADVEREKSQWADFVIIFFHWGVEGDRNPRQQEIMLAKAAIDAGADAIIGSHPHVPQPIGWYAGKPIAYSLGNFIFGGNRGGPDRGLLAEVILNDDGSVDMRGIPIRVNPQATQYQPYCIQ